MALNEKLKPINQDHSIKEAVIALFLANPLIKPERFQTLIESEFKNTFQRFEPLSQFQFQLNTQQAVENITPQFRANAGFKFSSFLKGKNEKVLQGINEPGRTFISYHSLNYLRWETFLNDFIDVIKIVSTLSQDLFVTAVSVHYIDEFIWVDNTQIDLKYLFNTETKYFPKNFFESTVNNYILTTESKTVTGNYIDRLELNIDHNIGKTINISHNVSQILDDTHSLNDLLSGTQFSKILNEEHIHNKEILGSILSNEAQNLIHLKRQS